MQVISSGFCIIGLFLNTSCFVITRKCQQQQPLFDHLSIHGLLLLLVLDILYCSVCLINDVTCFWNVHPIYYLECILDLITSFGAWVLVIIAIVQYIIIQKVSYFRSALVKCSSIKLFVAYSLAFINCILLALPSFWMFHHTDLSASRRYVTAAYLWARGTINVFIPLFIIAYINVRLILLLRQISSRNDYHTPYTQGGNVIHRQHLLLVMVLIGFYVLLVYPYELIRFCSRLFSDRVYWPQILQTLETVFKCVSIVYYGFKMTVFYMLLRPFRLEVSQLVHHVCPGCVLIGRSRRYVTGPHECPEIHCHTYNVQQEQRSSALPY